MALKKTGQLFCRMSLNYDLCAIFSVLMGFLRSKNSTGKVPFSVHKQKTLMYPITGNKFDHFIKVLSEGFLYKVYLPCAFDNFLVRRFFDTV